MINPDDSAFPSRESLGLTGLTKREWFAGMAMVGLLSKGGLPIVNEKTLTFQRAAIEIADALIAELNKKP